MRKNLKALLILLIISIALIGCKKVRQKAQVEPMPFSDKVVTGTLDNGLKYYIRHNDFPSDKIELRLNIRSGSLYEADNERGIAHFVEHMAFNGTKNFKGNDVIKFIEESGLVFGKDTNASTSTEYTNYQLTIPFDNDILIERGFLILRDWATNITFDEEEIEKEKGVVIEEWRARNDTRYRMRLQTIKHTLSGSLYPERDTIGLMEIINNADKPLLEGFYKKWYRPDNMAVIVVGNIDLDRAENLIKENFSDIEKPATEFIGVSKNVNYSEGIRTAIVSDKEAKGIFTTLYFYHPGQVVSTYNQFKEDFIKKSAFLMFNRRMNLAIQEKKLDLLSFRSSNGLLGDSADVAMFTSSITPNTFDISLKNMLIEIERVKKYGFSKEEFEYMKESQLSFLEKAAAPDYKFPSSRYADQISSFDIDGGYFTEFHQDKALVERVFSETNITSYNRMFNEMIGSYDILLIVSLPDSEKESVEISAEKLENIMAEVEKSNISELVEAEFVDKLIDKEIEAGAVISKTFDENLQTTEVIYANGVKLYIRENSEDAKKFIIHGKKKGGFSILGDDEYLQAKLMADVISKSGFEKISKRNLDMLLVGKNVSVTPNLSEYTFDFAGSGFFQDIESAFQLLYKYFTSARVDKDYLDAYIKSLLTKIELEASDKSIKFNREASYKMYNDNYRRAYFEKDDLENVKAENLLKIYRDNFLDINNYVFSISGDVATDEVIALASKYLGSLKAQDKNANFQDRNVYLRNKQGIFEDNGDSQPRTTLSIINMKKIDYNEKGKFIAGLVRNVLNIRLREAIREDAGGAYSVSTNIRYFEIPKNQIIVRISFPCEPEKKDEILKETLAVYNNFIAKGITDEELKSAKLVMKNNYSFTNKENKYWATNLSYNNLMGLKTYSLDDVNKIYDSLTLNEVNSFITNILAGSDSFITILNPENIDEDNKTVE